MISSLLHLVGLRPRVYYTLTNFRGGGAKAPWPPPQYANDIYIYLSSLIKNTVLRIVVIKLPTLGTISDCRCN